MSTQKIVETWEREKGMIIVNADHTLLKKNVSEDEFLAIMNSHGWRGVNYNDRAKFLKENGYEVNRANLIDPELSAIPRET